MSFIDDVVEITATERIRARDAEIRARAAELKARRETVRNLIDESRETIKEKILQEAREGNGSAVVAFYSLRELGEEEEIKRTFEKVIKEDTDFCDFDCIFLPFVDEEDAQCTIRFYWYNRTDKKTEEYD